MLDRIKAAPQPNFLQDPLAPRSLQTRILVFVSFDLAGLLPPFPHPHRCGSLKPGLWLHPLPFWPRASTRVAALEGAAERRPQLAASGRKAYWWFWPLSSSHTGAFNRTMKSVWRQDLWWPDTCEKRALPQPSVRALLKASGFEVLAYLGKNSERNLQVGSGFIYPPTHRRSVGHFRRGENARVQEKERERERETEKERNSEYSVVSFHGLSNFIG